MPRLSKNTPPSLAALALSVSLLGACAADDPHRRAKTGAAVGAVAGAVVGHQMHDRNGRFVGAAVGALTGAAVGNYMDRQQADLRQALARELGERSIRVTRIDEETLKLDLSSEATFDINSDSVQREFSTSLARVGDVLGRYDRTAVHLLGHTDDTGTESYNQSLSERRAAAVSRHLMKAGVDRARLRPRGFGESRPVASNDTSSGRSRNRRVEIYIKSVVEGRTADAFRVPS